MGAFRQLIGEVRACTLCAEHLPLGCRPVVQAHPASRILVVGQAPGTRVHASGIPFDDPSGDRLRDWMGIDKGVFYDPQQVALVPMGFCYPGRGRSGDLPPRPECAATWRAPLLALMPHIRLTLVMGQYAHEWHFRDRASTLTERVRRWQSYAPERIPLPHPSPRNNLWLRRNPWFECDLLPDLRQRVADSLAG